MDNAEGHKAVVHYKMMVHLIHMPCLCEGRARWECAKVWQCDDLGWAESRDGGGVDISAQIVASRLCPLAVTHAAVSDMRRLDRDRQPHERLS